MKNLDDNVLDKRKDSVVYLNIDEISCSYQLRCDNDALIELASSLKEYGVTIPVIVRRDGEKYDLIAGYLRLKAAKLAGITSVPAIVRDINNR